MMQLTENKLRNLKAKFWKYSNSVTFASRNFRTEFGVALYCNFRRSRLSIQGPGEVEFVKADEQLPL